MNYYKAINKNEVNLYLLIQKKTFQMQYTVK